MKQKSTIVAEILKKSESGRLLNSLETCLCQVATAAPALCEGLVTNDVAECITDLMVRTCYKPKHQFFIARRHSFSHDPKKDKKLAALMTAEGLDDFAMWVVGRGWERPIAVADQQKQREPTAKDGLPPEDLGTTGLNNVDLTTREILGIDAPALPIEPPLPLDKLMALEAELAREGDTPLTEGAGTW